MGQPGATSRSNTGGAPAPADVMRIAYFCCHADHLRLGALSTASARAYMPGVEIVHLTDAATDPLPGADTVLRFATEGNFWRRSWTALAALERNVLMVGTDTLFRRDVTEVFLRPFEVALPHIAGPHRYDAGTVFARSSAFFRRMADDPVALLPQAEFGIDAFLGEYHRHAWHAAAIGAGVLELPGRVYGYAPRAADDPGIKDAAIVHYRGPRKRWMLPGWNAAAA